LKPIKLAVRSIIEQVFRSGDIDNRFNDGSSMSRGSAAHRKIQQAAPVGYTKEVSLKLDVEVEGTKLQLHGRADGIITDPSGAITIDEIKSTTLPLDYIYSQHPTHLAQGKCYAYMYMKTLEHWPETITVQLTYFQLETEEIRWHSWHFSREELEAFFTDLLHKYSQWLRLEREWKITRNDSIATTDFPFPSYRKGQRELAVAVYRTIAAGKKLYASAPTGIGKTLSALFPSVKALGEDKAEKIFYLTAKTVTRTVAEDAVRLMAEKGLRFKSINLRAKEKICPNDECNCNPDFCINAKGHFDRINDAILDLLAEVDIITPEVTIQYGKKHRVCPHEYALEVSLWCDLIIGDYNHLFDPTVYLRRFFADDNGEYIFLIDETHNLADRVRDMYTATLSKWAFGKVQNALRGRDPITSVLRQNLKMIKTYFEEQRSRIDGYCRITKEPDKQLISLITDFTQAASDWLMAHRDGSLQNDILNLYFEASFFSLIADMYDSHYTTITEAQGSDVIITLFCLDPSDVIAAGLKRGRAAILFSATLTPLPYYRDILGGTGEDYAISLPSPFDPGRLATVVHSGISTKYIHRESSYAPIVKAIHTAISHKKGNYLVFFPSFEYLNKVCDLFCETHPTVETLVQNDKMTEDSRADFLVRFDTDNPDTLVGFAVLGGIFSEGIDLKGDRLVGSIIISVGLPKINLRQNQIRDYFNEKNGRGYDYAYVFPGMNKVLQAAGRVIRTEEDSGIVLLIDSRFAAQQYRELMPGHWTDVLILHSTDQLDAVLGKHWQGLNSSI